MLLVNTRLVYSYPFCRQSACYHDVSEIAGEGVCHFRIASLLIAYRTVFIVQPVIKCNIIAGILVIPGPAILI